MWSRRAGPTSIVPMAHRRTRPAPHPPRTLCTHDPAEILVHASLLLGEPARDSLLLIGVRPDSSTALSVRADLPEAPGASWDLMIGRVLEPLASSGARRTAGAVILGDGRDHIPAGRVEELGIPSAARVLEIAAGGNGPAVLIGEVWVIAAGRARRVRLRGDGPGDGPAVEVEEPIALAPADATLAAVEAVAAGEMLPRQGPDPVIGALRAGLAAGGIAERRIAMPRPGIESVWRAALEALAVLGDEPSNAPPEALMTACERVRELVGDLASVHRRDELLALVTGRGQGLGRISSERAIDVMTRSARRPHESVIAGGAWYEALRRIEAATRPAPGAEAAAPPARMVSGWASTACLLSLLAWWNHRFATAGTLVGTVLEHRPDHSLARLALVMATHPVRPGWSPGPST